MATYAVIYRYGNDTEAMDQHRPAHRDYLASLFDDGKIIKSGPLGEGGDPAALLVLEAADAREVATLLDKDPFYELDLIAEREIRAWKIAFGAAH